MILRLAHLHNTFILVIKSYQVLLLDSQVVRYYSLSLPSYGVFSLLRVPGMVIGYSFQGFLKII